jgi:hypothetical protein
LGDSDLTFFVARRDLTCGEWGETLDRHAWITLDRERGRALPGLLKSTCACAKLAALLTAMLDKAFRGEL